MDFDFKTATPEQLRARYNDIATEMRETQFLSKKELDHVPHILQDGEQVLAFATGLMNNDTWLITLTDRRIIFLDKGMVYGLRQAVIDLDKVSSVSFTTRWLFGDIHIRDSSGTYQITNVWKKSIVPFTNRVQQAVDARKPANNPMPVYLVPPPLPDSDAASDAPLALAPPAAPAAAEEDIIEAAEVAGASRAHDTISVAAGIPEVAHAPQASASPVTPASPASQVRSDDEIISKLERLSALRDRGVLTDKEFAAQKTRILGA